MDKSLREIIVLLKKRFLLVLIAAVVGAGLMAAYTCFFVLPEYTARATFYVTNNEQENTYITYQDITASKSLVDTYIEIIKSNSTLSQVVESLPQYALTEEILLQRMNLSVVNETEIFKVEVTCTDPVEARDIVAAIMEIGPQEIVRVIQAGAVSIVDSVELPTQRHWPFVKYVIMGTIVGAALMLVVIFVMYALDTTVYSKYDLEKNYDIAVLGMIPDEELVGTGKSGKKKKKRHHSREGWNYVLNSKSDFSIQEAYRSAGINVTYLPGKGKCKRFAITSAYPREEKTITSINLAISLSDSGKRVLLIDADLRKPMISNYLQLKIGSGLSEFLAGIEKDPILYHSEGSNLWVFPSKRTNSVTTELLASERMNVLLEWAEDKFDYVILDTPPINVVPDASVLSGMIDGYLFMVRSGFTNLHDIEDALVALNRVDANVCGFVLNGIDPFGTVYGGYYGKHTSKYSYRYKGYQKYAAATKENIEVYSKEGWRIDE